MFSFSLYGLSPEEALLPDNTAFLQQKIFKARRDKAQKYLKKRPPFKIGDKVRKIIRDKFKQRVNTHKWSSEKYTITGVRKTAPWTFFLSGNGKKSFYSHQLLGEGKEEEEREENEPRQGSLRLITSILSQKTVPTGFLRSGAAKAYEDIYLVTLPSKKRRYMNRTELAQYSNGLELLNRFLSK